jgi:2-polyprenyl-3-methyl-5-hydroxy-6-metoxy-1,4-benzoquinol methylase
LMTPELLTRPTVSETAPSRCLLCGSPARPVLRNCFDTRFGIDETFEIQVCGRCELHQTSPRPSPEAFRDYYEKYYNFSGESGTTYTGRRERFLNSKLYDLWLLMDGDVSFHARRGRGRLLDYGCNEGRGLMRYQANGFEAEGLEFNPRAAQAARSLGFTVWVETLDQVHPAQPYDVIVLSNVLEHALDPRQMLSQARNLLNENGEVWISCPNHQSLWRRVFGLYWINWHVPFHIAHFSLDNLKSILAETGFQIEFVQQVTPALWLTHSLLAAFFAKRGHPTRQLRSAPLIILFMLFFRGILFPILWLANQRGHGDCLVLRARKA